VANKRLNAAALLCLAAGLTGLTWGCHSDPDRSAAGSKQNVLLVVADALRADYLGCYGQSAPTSPNLDRIAGEGALFETCRTVVPQTLPSFVSLFTSRYPKDHGAATNLILPKEALTFVSDVFRRAGYETAFFVSSYCLSSRFRMNQGFDFFSEKFDTNVGLRLNKVIRSGRAVTDDFIEWYRGRDRSKPFFAVLHYFDPHFPYLPPEEYAALFVEEVKEPRVTYDEIVAVRKSLVERNGEPDDRARRCRDMYRAEIRYMDDQIGRVVDAVDRPGSGPGTIFVFTADHGETLWEHDDYISHGISVYAGSIRIPLIFRAPGIIPPGRYAAPSVSSIDIAPTLLGFAGIEIPEEFAGEDLHGAVLGRTERRDADCLFSEAAKYPESITKSPDLKKVRVNFPKPKCIMSGPWKYIWTPYMDNREELYNLLDDPAEQNNLAGAPGHEERSKEFRRRLIDWALDFESAEGGAGKLTPGDLEKLESLGYGR